MARLIQALRYATLVAAAAAAVAVSPAAVPSTAAAAPAGLIAVVGLDGLTKTKDHFVPLVLSAAQNLTIPGEKTSQFHFDDIHITQCTLGSSAVTFVKASQSIGLALDGLSLSTGKTGFEVIHSIKPFGHLHCSGHFSAAVKNTDISVLLKVINANGLPQITATTAINFGSVDVSHDMTHESCKIAEKIVRSPPLCSIHSPGRSSCVFLSAPLV
jgi:hypothetical protein